MWDNLKNMLRDKIFYWLNVENTKRSQVFSLNFTLLIVHFLQREQQESIMFKFQLTEHSCCQLSSSWNGFIKYY